MALSDLTSPTAVKLAMSECDLLGRDDFLRRYGFATAREYVLRHEGKEYDSKAIAGVAHGLQNPTLGPLKSDEFSGGIHSSAAGTRIFELGFDVQGKKRGPRDWSLSECEQTVESYFECLGHKIRGEKFNRDAACQTIAARIGRTKGAVDYKFQNIDAILHENQLPRLNNAIAQNVQRLLRFVVLDPLAKSSWIFSDVPIAAPKSLSVADIFVAVPQVTRRLNVPSAPVEHHRTLLDFAVRDAVNRALGRKGEEWVLSLERRRLKEVGRADLAQRVRWISQVTGDGAGYDIESFDKSGSLLFVEVKTTNAGANTPFFISPNELAVADYKGAAYRLYRVFNFYDQPRVFVLEGPLTTKLQLQAHLFSALPAVQA